MKTKLAVVVGVVAIAALAIWQLTGSESAGQAAVPEPTPVTPMASQMQERAATAPSRAQAPDTQEDRRLAPTTPAETWSVSGRALRGEQPFPGLALIVRVWEGETLDAIDLERRADQERELTSDEDGHFTSPFEPPSACSILVIQPTGAFDDGLEYSWRPVRLELGVEERPEWVELRLRLLDAALVGTVSDPEGQPIPGASVRLFDEPVLTDEDGRYRMQVSARRHLYVYAEAHGYAQVRALVGDVAAGQERTADFALKEELRVEGTVRDGRGQPLADALVTSFFTSRNDARTDAAGRYVLGHLDPGRPQHMVNVRKEGWVLAQATVQTEPDGVVEQDFTLDRGVRVEGRVVDPAGAPVAEAALYIGFSPNAFNRLNAVSGADGSFVFPSVQRGAENLVVQREGFGPWRQVITMPEDRDRLRGLEVVLEPGHFIGGHVVDEAGQPLEGIWVSVDYFGESLDLEGETDADGFFYLEDLPGSDLELYFYGGEARQSVEHPLDAVDLEDLVITMPAAGAIAGRVLDGATGEPVDSFRVRFVEPELLPGEERLWGYRAAWGREGWRFDGTDGYWNTDEGSEELTPGHVIGIEVLARGYAPAVVSHAVVGLDPDPDALVHRLFAGCVVAGTVVDAAGGDAVADALVKLYRAGEHISLNNSEDTHRRPLAKTDATGRFRFADVGPGEHRILVLSGAHVNQIDGPFDVLPEGGAERMIELRRGAVVNGVLRDLDGSPRADTAIELTPDEVEGGEVEGGGGFSNLVARTDAEGRYRFDGLPAGSFRIGPRAGDVRVNVQEYDLPLELSAAETQQLDLAPPGTARLVGRIQHDGPLPPAMPVRLVPASVGAGSLPAEGPSFGGLARNGTLELRGLTPGSYAVSVAWHDWGTSTWWTSVEGILVTLAAGSSSEVWIEVQSSPR